MTDKEMLELAAKAAGIEWQHYDMGRGLRLADIPGTMVIPYYWNPLKNDGDAFGLAVKCNLVVIIDGNHGMETEVWPYGDPDAIVREDHAHEGAAAATRRAIFRAAIEMGKRIKQPPEVR